MLEQSLMQFSLKAANELDELWGVMPENGTWAGDAAEAGLWLQHYLGVVHKLGQAADAGRLVGLQSVCNMLESNLQMLLEGRSPNTQEVELLSATAERLLGYVMSQGDADSIEALVQHLQLASWPQALAEDDAVVLRLMLSEAPLVGTTAEESLSGANSAAGEVAAAHPETVRPPTELQQVDVGMLDMLRKEFAQMVEPLNEDLGNAIASHL